MPSPRLELQTLADYSSVKLVLPYMHIQMNLFLRCDGTKSGI